MEGEERNKIGLKRRVKQVEVGVDSGDDDETIGSFLKLKSKRNIKKNKLGSDSSGVKDKNGDEKSLVDDEDLVGMDDTLASFRKKLRAPKKDGSRLALVGKDLGSSVVALSDQSLHQLVEDGGLATKVAEEALVDGDDGNEGTVDKGLEVAARRKIRNSGVALEVKKIGNDFEPDDSRSRRDHQRSGNGSSEHEKEVALASGEDSFKCSDDGLEDSLSTFFRKAQSSFTRKSRSSTRLKLEKDTQAPNGSNQISNDVSEDTLLGSTSKSQSALNSSNELTESNEDVHQASDRAMVDPVKNLQAKFSDASSSADISSSPLVACETLKPSKNFADASTTENLVNQYSMSGLRISSNTAIPVQPAGLTRQTSSFWHPPETPKMEATDIFSHVEIPVSVAMNDNHFDEGASLKVSNNDPKIQSNSISTDHVPETDQKTCSSVRKEVLQSCCKSPSMECEDKSPRSHKQVSDGIKEPSTSPIEDKTTSKEKTSDAENSHDWLGSMRSVQDPDQAQMVQSLSYPVAPKKECSLKHCDYPVKDSDNGIEQTVVASISSGKEDAPALEHGSSPISACEISKYELSVQVKDQVKSLKHSNDFNNSYESPTTDDPTAIRDDEAKGASSPSDMPDLDESYAEAVQVLPDSENNTNRQSAVRRKAKKRRHGDMAYEGDADWEVLTQEQEFLVSHQLEEGDQSSKTREKFISSVNGGAAAISAGLKARAVGPVEKIKFKDVLKRKGGLQEYLECRNFILSLWNKDVSRILPLSECGVSDILVDEPSRASLVRDIYSFLDQSGYINFGIASEKAENGGVHSLKLLKEENFVEKSGAPASDANDGVSFILGRVKNSENSSLEKPEIVVAGGEQVMRDKLDERFVDLQSDNDNTQTEPDRLNADINEESGASDAKVPDEVVCLDTLGSDTSSEDENSRMPVANLDIIPPCSAEVGSRVPVVLSEDPKAASNLQPTMSILDDGSHSMICDSDSRKRIIVVGAGPAGLTAARHLQRQGFHVTVLEGRDRIGGRVFTDRSSLSVPVDLGASIITGVEADVATERRADPSSLVCAQLGLELTVLNSDCPLYDTVSGHKVPADLDEALEAEYNSLLDDMLLLVAQKGEQAERMSLEDGLEYALKVRCRPRSRRNPVSNEDVSVDEDFPEELSYKAEILSPLERRVMDWHFAHLEYGCAALLKEVSLPYWNQDDVYGGFGGAHCMIKGGYSTVVESLGEGLNICLNHVVTEISYFVKDDADNDDRCKVKVSTLNGKEFSGDAVLITVPLGCLKAETIKFSPSLPQWKSLSIQRLGFGVLNKVVMEFPDVFWDDSIDYFGATAEETNQRGWCFMFWNVKKTVGAPVLIALVVGKAAIDGQNMNSSDHVNHALLVLRKLFGETAVPDPVASVVTDWGRDPYSYGAYSYVAVGSSGDDYDLLGRPVENCLFFAGEATCKEHPDTVGGAMMSGLREAVRIIDIFTTGTDYTAEVEVWEAAKRHSGVERSEIRDIIKRLDAMEFSNVMYKNSLDQTQILTRESLLKDLFYNAKTTAGRLHVVKELLKLPVQILRSFAGNKEGLSMLNSWMLDSMGKDGTQLLRHCVRLLVLVSTNLLAVRLSGIGKTVKEKVCVHTSRDIRAIASQLVSVWIEIFRKEKASNSGLKLLRQPTAVIDSSKNKYAQASGRPPLRMSHISGDNRGSMKVSASKNHLPSSSNIKKVNITKPEVRSSSSQGSDGRQNAIGEEDYVLPMTEEEKAAFAAAEAARAAAVAAAEAYASSGTKSSILQLPKIPSFHKFARREQYARMDESEVKKIWSRGGYGKQDCLSEIDSRNCRVRDWPVDFSAAGVNLDTSKMSVDNHSQQSQSNEIAGQVNFREHSGESVAVDSGLLTKAWVDSVGSEGIKDYSAIERWQCQAAAANSDYFHQSVHITDEEDSNVSSKLPTWTHEARVNESSASQVTVNKEVVGNQSRGAESIKRAVIDYVASLLMPLYKARKIDKDGYKSIMKKTATKVMEQTTDAEKAMAVFEFLDFKRKNKIRAFVDRLIERHMAMKEAPKS